MTGSVVTDEHGNRYHADTHKRLPPARGVPYYSERHGHLRIVPKEGGKSVPYHKEGAAPKFDPGRALKRAGLAADNAAGRVGRAGMKAGRTVTAPVAETAQGWGSALVYIAASLLGLILLELLLGKRSPKLVGATLSGVSSFIRRLVSPIDPLIGYTPPGSTSSLASAPVVSGTVPVTKTVQGSTAAGYSYPKRVAAGSQSGVGSFKWLRAAPNADVEHVDTGLLSNLNALGQSLGKVITITSGYRDPDYSAAVGGYSNDPHTRGVAVDATIDGSLIGDWLSSHGHNPVSTIGAFGLESGDQPGFYNRKTDPEHIQIPGSGVNKAIHALATLIGR